MNPMQGVNSKARPFFTALLQAAWLLEPRAYLSSAVRSSKTQAALYADWVAGRRKLPAAPPGSSKHERGLAIDIGGLTASQQRQLGALWEGWGGRWGGRFSNPDPVHFEV